MNTKTQRIFAVSLTAIFALSMISSMTIQDASADKGPKFHKKPDFTAEFDVMMMNVPENYDGSATAKLWFDKNGEFLKYRILIENMDISGFGDKSDDMTKVHFHDSTDGNAHVLNVYKAPGQDDNDLIVKPTKGIIKGIWDDSDVNTTYPDHHNWSVALSEKVEQLCNGDLFFAIHGTPIDGAPADMYLKGNIEPTKSGEKFCKKLLKHQIDDEEELDDHSDD